MISLLSPAKSLDFESPLPTRRNSQPRFAAEAAQLIDRLREMSLVELAALMGISEKLAALNVTRYAEFEAEHRADNARPAALAFNGPVYQGLDAATLSERDLTEAQKTTRVLSGLYGLLRPLDLIQPHRLEMGTRLATERGDRLYDWWGDQITDLIKQDVADSPGADVVINLASNEYFGSVNEERLDCQVISPRFEDRDKNGRSRIVVVFAKRARGLMARWLIQDRARTPSRVLEFAEEGYQLDESRSTPEQPVFVR